MLRSLVLENFKSFAHTTIPFEPLTVFVGLNAAGKSNAFDALRVLQGLAVGYTLTETLEGKRSGGVQEWPGIRGGDRALLRGTASTALLESSWELADLRPRYLLRLERVAPDLPLAIDETLFDGMDALWNARETQPPYSLLSRLELADAPRKILHNRLRASMANLTFLDVRPDAMREWVIAIATDLGQSGENLSAVLARRLKDDVARARLEDWLGELLGDEAKRMQLLATPTGEVMLALEEADGSLVAARSLSDGTLRFLGEIVAAEELARDRTLLMEDPDHGLHPARVQLLVQKLESETQPETGKQVVVTTHSPQFLNWLSKDRWPGVVLFHRDPATHETRATRLVDLPTFDTRPEGSLLGDLLTTEWMERAV